MACIVSIAGACLKAGKLLISKGKSIPLQTKSGPEFQEAKVPRFHENGAGWWQGCHPYAPAAFTPRKCSWYSFLLEAELTPGP